MLKIKPNKKNIGAEIVVNLKEITNKEILKKETLNYLNIFKDHPYIFNLGHGVLPETNPDMVDYLVKTVKDY